MYVFIDRDTATGSYTKLVARSRLVMADNILKLLNQQGITTPRASQFSLQLSATLN